MIKELNNYPVCSYGILCFNINMNITNIMIDNYFNNNYFNNKFINLNDFNSNNLNNVELISNYYDKIKILMIRRRYSLNYIEFIRGKYDCLDKTQLKKIFELMTQEENSNIENGNFDDLWNTLWKETSKNKKYQK